VSRPRRRFRNEEPLSSAFATYGHLAPGVAVAWLPGQRSRVSARVLVLAMCRRQVGDCADGNSDTTRHDLAGDQRRSTCATSRGCAASATRIGLEYAQPLDVEAFAPRRADGTSAASSGAPTASRRYAYLITRRIERAMALLRRGDLSVTEVCFAVGCSPLGTLRWPAKSLRRICPNVSSAEPYGGRSCSRGRSA
jgi:AraC-like DNA-binding protein